MSWRKGVLHRHLHDAGLLAAALMFAAAAAEGQGIRASIDRSEATVEDQLLLTVTVEGSRSATPRLPDLPDFDVLSRGQSSQVQIVNATMTVSVTYNYLLLPKRTGTFRIGPATVEIGGKSYQSKPFTVRVVDASSQPRGSRDLFVTARVSKRDPYVGEQVVYTWRFYRRVRLADARLESQEFGGLLVEDLGEVREYRSTVGGVEYMVSEIRKALFPQEEGALTIPESRLRCEVIVQSRRRSVFDDFLGRAQTETKLVRSAPIELTVRPLPAPPRGFSGLVGDFGIKARISKSQLKVGESATLQLTISGTGNANAIGEPRLPELTAFKVYDDKPSSSVNRSGNRLSGYKTFRKALVPLEPGDLAVPPVALVYFEPKSGSYRTDYTPPLSLQVSPAEGKEELRLTHALAPNTGKVAVRILADDILPIYKGLDAVAPRRPAGLMAGLWLGGLVLPPLAFLGVLVIRRRQERFEQDSGLLRRRQALRKALSTMRRLEKETSGDDSAATARLASRCLREFVGDKLGLEGSALTAEETDAQLRQHGVDEELAARTHRLLDRLEAAQYGARQAAGEISQLSGTVKELLRQIDRRAQTR